MTTLFEQDTDTEGFAINPTPPVRPFPRTPEAKAQGCTCYASPTRDEAQRIGMPWEFARGDCPVHGMEARQ